MTTNITESQVTKNSSDDDVVLSVQGVSKKFCRSLKRSLFYGIQDIGSELVGVRKDNNQLRKEEFWALQDVSFELKKGECLGLIGRNGAGKTTLLKLLNNLIKPDCGYIKVVGNVSGLIALGAGFNPILTGRENVYVNGAILGLSKKEIDAKFDEIVAFSELEKFIDTPVQSYSSGMQVRLGFAVAAVLIQPDILLLDEVLAVGDIGFTIKCLNRVHEIAKNSAVILVTHSMQYLSLFCSRILLLKYGQVVCNTSDVGEGIDKYLSTFSTKSNITGTGQAKVTNICLSSIDKLDQKNCELQITSKECLNLKFEVEIKPEIKFTKILVSIQNQNMNSVISCPLIDQENQEKIFLSGKHSIDINFDSLNLVTGKYYFMILIQEVDSKKILTRLQQVSPFRIVGKENIHWSQICNPVQCKVIKLI
jgi:lipopolysaccharide transport system ATP-binding protein